MLLSLALCLRAQEPLVVVGADNDFPPFEYTDSNGRPTGYTIDLITAVAKETGLNIRIVSGPWRDIRRQFDNGQIDVLSGMFYSSQRASSIEFTIPHSSVTYSIFVRKGGPRLRSVADLQGRSVWVQQGDIAFDRLTAQGVRVLPLVDEQAALTKLARGQGDAVVAAKVVGLYLIRQLGLRNVQLTGDIFEQQQYCFAVRRNRPDQLLEKLNEGLTLLKYNGVQQQIAAKWLSPWERGGVSLHKVLLIVAVLAGLLLLAFAWSWTLRQQVRQHTASLQMELAERRRAEARILKLNRLYEVTTEVNKALVRIRDRDALLTEVCRLIVEHGGLQLAWVGLVDAPGHRLVPVAAAGDDSHYLKNIEISTLEGSPEGRGPGGTCAREGRMIISNDIAADDVMGPWRPQALARSYRSCASLPIQVDNRTVAVLALYASEPQFFNDEEERALLNGVARDISFALEAIDREQRRKRAETALHHSEERFRTAFEQAAVGMTLCDMETRIQAVNSSFCKMLGYSRDELLGAVLSSPELTHPQDVQASKDYVGRMFSGELPRAFWEKRYLSKDGQVVWAQVVASVMRDEHGRPLTLITQIQDITARKRAEQERQQAFETLEGIFRASPAAIVLLDSEFNVRAWNKASEQMFGWLADEVLGRRLPIVPPESWSLAREHHALILRGETLSNTEVKARKKDGTLLDISVSGSAIRDAAGRYTEIVAVFADITERKRAEADLREAYETLQAILRTSPAALLALDLEGNVTAWNQASERMFGWTAEEVMGRPLPIIPGDQVEVHRELRERIARGEGITNNEMKRQRKDGTLLDVSFSVTPFRDAEGRINGGLAAYMDLTERKRLEAQLLQSQKLESVGRLAGGVAHDFNNLLTVINCHSDLLLEQLEPGSQLFTGLQEIRKAGEQASSLTRQLLAFSRRQMLKPRIVDLNGIVQEIREMLQRLLGEDIELVIDLEHELRRVKADPGQLQQVIMNLAVNARDAMPRGGRLSISTANVDHTMTVEAGDGGAIQPPQVVLTVSDTGSGMDEETQRHIFEPFFTTKPAGKGTGLGLSMVWGIVKQSGGHLWVHSEPGKGTAFKVLLPPAEEQTATEEVRPQQTVSVRGAERILLVEDQAQLRHLTSQILNGYGYRVIEASNGAEALRILGQNGVSVDLVLTDIVMPGITGIELGRQIRSLRPEIKLLYMSGYTDDVILRQGALQAGSAYLEKPFTPDGLAAKIRQVLAMSTATTDSNA